MNGAVLGFSSRVQSAAIARTMKRAGQSYATLDVRRLIAEGFPAPVRVPQVVLVATRLRTYHTLDAMAFDQQLNDYIQRGGKVLYIMGTSQLAAKSLARHSEKMHRQDDKSTLPVTDEQFLEASMEIVGSGDQDWKVARPARTHAGWHQPCSCPNCENWR